MAKFEDEKSWEKGASALEEDYGSSIVEWFQGNDNRLEHGETTIVLAREFGFCYGVSRAVEYAYQARRDHPDKRIFITGEIIHNPGVNSRLSEMGVQRLPSAEAGGDRLEGLTSNDVVLIPAFGIEQSELERLHAIGPTLIDTTCGSVLNVWKSVRRYAREGFTSIIHGKFEHEETRATGSQVLLEGGHYLIVRDIDQTRAVCDYIEGRGDRGSFLKRFRSATSPGFDPDSHLDSIGLANQTTMLSTESMEIAEMLKASIMLRHGDEPLADHYRSFETICSATQQRQDAVAEMLAEGVDVLVVIGGFNSSNTAHLVEIGLSKTPTFHVQTTDDFISKRWIRHKPVDDPSPVVTGGWLPEGRVVIGVTGGASTPNSEIGRVIKKLLSLCGVPEAVLEEVEG